MGREKPPKFKATIGLGSNMGDKAGNIARAIDLIEASNGANLKIVATSRLYKSPPWGVTSQDWFINAAIAITTTATPRALLQICQSVENAMGRVREQRWGPRIIDADILTYEDWSIDEPDLKIPHPLIAERAFVLLPLKDVAPSTRIAGRSLNELIAELGTAGTIPFDATEL